MLLLLEPENTENKKVKKEYLDYPPAYPNGNLHLGHMLESCMYYSYYNLSDYQTWLEKNKGIRSSLVEIIASRPDYIKKSIVLNLGLDNNGLPITLAVKKKSTGIELNKLQLFKRCKTLLDDNCKDMYETYKKLGLCDLRAVNNYNTQDNKFRNFFNRFYSALKPKIEYMYRPHLYCPNCKTFLSNAEVSEKDTPTATYYFPVLDEQNNVYEVMTKRPDLLPGVAFFSKNPTDERYTNLKSVRLTINDVEHKFPVYDSTLVNKDAGTGLVYVSPWGGTIDYKIIKQLDLEIESTLYDSRGQLKDEPLKKYNLSTWAEVLQKINNLRVVEKVSTIKELYHTERSSCNKLVVYIPSKEVVLPIKEDLKLKILNKIQDLKCTNLIKDKLTHVAINLKEWCISRGEEYYSFEETYKEKNFLVDTWAISCLTPLLGQENSVVRCQGSDIITTWTMYTLIAECILESRYLDKLIIHKMVVDAKGEKFSKSKGNTISPELLIEKYGLKTLRYYFCEKPLEKDIMLKEKQIYDVSKFFKKLENLNHKLATDLYLQKHSEKEDLKEELEDLSKVLLGKKDLRDFKDQKLINRIIPFYIRELEKFNFSTVLFECKSWVYYVSKNLKDFTPEELKIKYLLLKLIETILQAFD